MNAQPQPIRSLDDDVAEYLELAERIEQLQSQQSAIKARFVERGLGEHRTSSGVVVSVGAPSRRFNLDRAWSMLTPDQQAVCVSPDAAKVKKQLPPVLADECMDEGTGSPVVRIK